MHGDTPQPMTPPAPASASGATGTSQPATMEFKAVDNESEVHSGFNLMVAAYAAIWVILMGWLFLLWRKQSALHTRIDDLEREIDKAAEKAEKAAKQGAR